MLTLSRLCACYALALLLVLGLFAGLMFARQFALLELWLLTGKPLAQLLLVLLPERCWLALTGVAHAAEHPAVQSFLRLCMALGQSALVPALGFYRLWYRP